MTGVSKPKSKFLMLLKNDFFASARVISLFYIALVLLLGLFGICVFLQKGDFLSAEMLSKVSSLHNATIAITIVVSFLLIFVTFFFVVYDFFKSLFGPQGYLSFTLPVSSNQLLGSKVIRTKVTALPHTTMARSISPSPTAAASFSDTVTTRRTQSAFRAPRWMYCS